MVVVRVTVVVVVVQTVGNLGKRVGGFPKSSKVIHAGGALP